MRILVLPILCGLAGCASQTTTLPPSAIAPTAPLARAAEVKPAKSVMVTRYELGEYRASRVPPVSRETAVFRTTRGPVKPTVLPDGAATLSDPANHYVPATFEPLPPSVELAAELAAQKEITEKLRAMSATMLGLEKQAQGQFGALVAHSEETAKLQKQLEGERLRVRDLEMQLRERLEAAPASAQEQAPMSDPTPAPAKNW